VRLDRALANAIVGGRTVVVPYLLVDRARRGRVRAIVHAMAEAGATALELGFPFSEPIADGPALAEAHARSLGNGTRWADLLEDLRVASPVLPTAVMTYANPLAHRGLDVAVRDIAEAGGTGLIVPDLSLEEAAPFRSAARRSGVSLVLLAAPGVTSERVRRVADASEGFLYLVGHYGTTGGATRGSETDLAPIVRAAWSAHPGLPVLVGFGIRDRASAERALRSGADGVVVGTAIEQLLAHGPGIAPLSKFVRDVSGARVPRGAPRRPSDARPVASD
jgi:tryptophan synthase alpha chain